MGTAILASAFLVLEWGALVIYDGIKNFLAHAQRGEVAGREESGHLTKLTFKNTNTLYFIIKFTDIMIYILIYLCIILFYPKTI